MELSENTAPENTSLEIATVLKGVELPEQHIKSLIKLYRPFAEQAVAAVAQASTISVEVEGDEEGQKAARDARLELKKIRNEAEKTRKANKKIVLTMGKANDLPYKAIEAFIQPVEELMQRFEDFDKNLKAARIEKLKNHRLEELRTAGILDEETDTSMLGLMTPAMFEAFKDELQQAIDDAQAAQEAQEAQEEEARLAREAELQQLQEKNALLQKQAEEAQATAKQLKADQQAAQMIKAQEAQEAAKLAAGPDVLKIKAFLDSVYGVENPQLTTPDAINAFQIIAMKFDSFYSESMEVLKELQDK